MKDKIIDNFITDNICFNNFTEKSLDVDMLINQFLMGYIIISLL